MRSIMKKQLITELINRTKNEITLIEENEKEDVKSVTEEQVNENIYENTREEEIGIIAQSNLAIDDLKKRLDHLENISVAITHDHVALGALVTLNTGTVLVSTAFPKTKVNDLEVTGISTDSPLYQKMEGLKQGAEFHLTGHNTEFIIEAIQ